MRAPAPAFGSITRNAEVSESATQTRPSGPTARPDGCANHASVSGPSIRPSFAVPPRTRIRPAPGSSSHTWWMPAIATRTVDDAGNHTTSHGDDRVASSAANSPVFGSLAIHWRPVPATVHTSPSASRTPRSKWFIVSATTTSYPTRPATSPGSRHSPAGSASCAVPGPPSVRPRSPVPIARSSVSPSAASSTRRWWPASATRKVPPGSPMSLDGKRRVVAAAGGGTYGPSPRCSVPFASCSSIRSAIRTDRLCACPSPARWATT